MNAKVLRGKRGMAVRGITRALLVLFLVSPMWAYALGLGEIKLRSALEEPFDAEIELTSVSKSVLKSLQVKLGSKEDFARVGIKPVAAVKLLRFEVVQKPDGGAAIHITTSEPIHDPYLNFLVEANWGRGRVLREYTVLLDPPELAGEETPIIEAPPVAAAEPEPATPAPSEALDVEPPPVSPAVVEPEVPVPDLPAVEGEELIEPEPELTQVAEPEPEAVVEPEPLPPLDDEALLAPESEPEQTAEPEVVEPEPLPVLDDEALIDETVAAAEEEGATEVMEPAPVVTAEEGTEQATAETKPTEEAFPEVGEVTVATAPVEEAAPLSYTVKRGDTLWSIAQQMRGDRPVSVYQVMMALFYNNPDAFFKGNVNNLKAGSILRIEDEGELSAISNTTAKSEFWQQYRAWQEYKQMLAKNVVTQGETPELAPGEVISEKTYTADEVAELPEASRATAEGEGAQLKLVSPDEVEPEAPAAEAVAETGKESAEPSEEKPATEKPATSASLAELESMREKVLAEIESSEAGTAQNQALREKLVALEEQIASLQRVVSVKDTELAALQQDIAEETTQPAAGLADEVPAKPVEEGLIAKLNRSPQLMGVLGGIALLVLAWLWLTIRNRGNKDDEEPVAVAGGDAAALMEEASEAFTEETEEELLSRVDSYVEEGKHAAAVELLTEAIERDPDNENYRYRLLDLHYEMKNREGFQREAEELYSRTGGMNRERWGKVAAMGAALLPTHALFAENEVGTAEESDVAEGDFTGEDEEVTAGDEWDDLDLESELEDAVEEKEDEGHELIEEVLGDDTAVGEFPEEEGDETSAGKSSESSDDDWEGFELEEDEEISETFLLEEEILDDKPEEQEVDNGIEFNLTQSAVTEESAVDQAEESGEELSMPSGSGEVLEFTRREEGGMAAKEPESSAEETDNALDLDFDIESESEEETSIAESGEELSLQEEEDDELLSLDEDEHAFPTFSEYDAMAEDSELLDDVDEIGTKLDLARAYIDMGDKEAARSMLDEVKQEGDPAQKEEADQLLAQLGG